MTNDDAKTVKVGDTITYKDGNIHIVQRILCDDYDNWFFVTSFGTGIYVHGVSYYSLF
jgi:hypothetical protein